jgi:hypothetical protein
LSNILLARTQRNNRVVPEELSHQQFGNVVKIDGNKLTIAFDSAARALCQGKKGDLTVAERREFAAAVKEIVKQWKGK